jgi:hypothetical protein
MGDIRRKLPGRTAFAALAVAVIVVVPTLTGIAGARQAITIPAGNLSLTFNGEFFPKVLPPSKAVPVGLTLSGKVATMDGSRPPALEKLLLEVDKDGAIDVGRFPSCNPRNQGSQFLSPTRVEELCKGALIGGGTAKFWIVLPNGHELRPSTKLLIINGGFKAGVTTLYAYGYVAAPTPTAVVTTIEIKKIHRGRYGTEATLSIPVVAGGAGSITSFSATIRKQRPYKSRRISVITLKCSSGHILIRGQAFFSDGTTVPTRIRRPCTAAG